MCTTTGARPHEILVYWRHVDRDHELLPAGYSVQNGVVVVDLSRMNSVKVGICVMHRRSVLPSDLPIALATPTVGAHILLSAVQTKLPVNVNMLCPCCPALRQTLRAGATLLQVTAGSTTATIGGGATHNQMYRGLWAAGRYAFPGGTTGIVGFGGLALGEPDGLAPLCCLLMGKTASQVFVGDQGHCPRRMLPGKGRAAAYSR